MKTVCDWPRKPFEWIEDRVLHISVPFTWNLKAVKGRVMQRDFLWDRVRIGGPAVDLLPDFFQGIDHVQAGGEYPGVLQKVNPQATRTSYGCIRKCSFCGIGKDLIEGGPQRELEDWPNLPQLTDNNLLANSNEHFTRVITRLAEKWDWADFNQGLDARLLTQYHAEGFAEIKNPIIRLALDSPGVKPKFLHALEILRKGGIKPYRVRSYVLIAFTTGPEESWARCKWVEALGVKPLPMWYHPLNTLEVNKVTPKQETLGWNDYERRKIMQWFYQHKHAKKGPAEILDAKQLMGWENPNEKK